MLQRIQSIWLLLAGAAALLTFKMPYYGGIKDSTGTYYELNAASGGFPLLLVTVIVALVAFAAIGLFKNRVLQLRLCIAGIGLAALLQFLYYRQVSLFTQGNYSLAAVLHMFIILFFVLAARGISRDEKMVKGSERLR